MIKSFFRRIKALRLYNSGERAIIEKRLDDALAALQQIDYPPLYRAKAKLLVATTLHKQAQFDDAEAAYLSFMEHYAVDIAHPGDRLYLREYAQFFAGVIKSKRKARLKEILDPSRLHELAQEATLATRGEFPPIDPS